MTAWVGSGLAVAGAVACWVSAGVGLGLFFSGFVFAALLVPPLCLAETRLIDRLLVTACVCDGIAVIWLITVIVSPLTFMQWILCYVALFAWCLALAGCSTVVMRILRSSVPASCIVVVIAMLWLSWPVWLSKPLLSHPQWVSYLVPPHPLFAINGVLPNLGIWSERPIAYRYLFTIGQDVPYELPRSILGMVVVHGLIGGIALAASPRGKR